MHTLQTNLEIITLSSEFRVSTRMLAPGSLDDIGISLVVDWQPVSTVLYRTIPDMAARKQA
jgi:hypothetical protein